MAKFLQSAAPRQDIRPLRKRGGPLSGGFLGLLGRGFGVDMRQYMAVSMKRDFFGGCRHSKKRTFCFGSVGQQGP